MDASHPVRIVEMRRRPSPQMRERGRAFEAFGGGAERIQYGEDLAAQTDRLAAARVRYLGPEAEAARLKAVVVVHLVRFAPCLVVLLLGKPGTQRLGEGRDRGRGLDLQRCVADADLYGAEFGLGSDIPIE